MKGLDLAENYYRAYGQELLESTAPELAGRAAFGLAGPGSECYGFDDEISRDHDWGPAFCVWLSEDDFLTYGSRLQAAYEALPRVFEGYGPRLASPGEEGRVGVMGISSFFRTHTGLDHPPATLGEWLFIPERNLSLCTNGRVFSDPLGEFSARRNFLSRFYPEDIRLKKLASRCITAGQSGQYNLPRSLKRGDGFSARYALMNFCTQGISLVFLLNRQYAPYYKWMHRGVRRLPLLGERTYEVIQELTMETNWPPKADLIENFCQEIIGCLRSQGLSDSRSDFLPDHAAEVHGKIQDRILGERMMVTD